MADTIFELSDIYKRFGERDALEGINLSIKEGEVLAILGPSGAGKTTLLRILDTLEEATSGRLIIGGKHISSVGERELIDIRRRMALLIQGAPLMNTSVFENVAFPLKIRGFGKEEIQQKVRDALRLFALEGYEDRRAWTLSGGEKQRVTFAMATVFNPQVLLLDEPTVGLDPLNEASVEEFITKMKDRGITIILSTHKQDEALALADRIAVLVDGRIEQVGTPAEIFYNPRTRFVARFTGIKNIFEGTVVSSEKEADKTFVKIHGLEFEVGYADVETGSRVYVCIRPEDVMVLREDRPIKPIHVNLIEGTIIRKGSKGSSMERLWVDTSIGEVFVYIPRHVVDVMGLREGKTVRLSLKRKSCFVVTD
jgi:tungstate transport system ATP-binding protein